MHESQSTGKMDQSKVEAAWVYGITLSCSLCIDLLHCNQLILTYSKFKNLNIGKKKERKKPTRLIFFVPPKIHEIYLSECCVGVVENFSVLSSQILKREQVHELVQV